MRSIQILNDHRFVTPKDADRMVYRGEAIYVFVGAEGTKALRYVDEHEARLIRRAIADNRERAMDNAMIASGRRVVFWNGAADPDNRLVPGAVRS